MTHFFHITTPQAWNQASAAGTYHAPSLDTEGFIHGSYLHQVLGSATKHYEGQRDLILLEIDPALLSSPVVVEDSYGSGQCFPHVYGPIQPSAVLGTHPLVDCDDGSFAFRSELADRAALLPTASDIDGANHWRGGDVAKRVGEWSRTLSDAEVRAVDALARAQDSDSDDEATVAALGAEIRASLLSGFGFRLLKGFPIERWDQDQREHLMLRLGQAIGLPRSQNAAGHLVGHVRDVGADVTDPTTRIYQTNERQTFHTDSTDAVGLLCLRTAKEGGRSMLVSASYIYSTLLARRPDLAPLLFDPVATDRRGEQPEGMGPWFEIPVLSWFKSQLTVLYQRQYIESARRFPEAPHPDQAHTEALDLFDQIANEDGAALVMDLEPGDLQFVYNHGLLHDRTGFVDHADKEQRRYLLRLWISLPGDRELPEAYAQRYGEITVGARGGISINRQHAPGA